MVSQIELSDFVSAKADALGIPGVVVGILMDGQEMYASHGVTSTENPLPVDHEPFAFDEQRARTLTGTYETDTLPVTIVSSGYQLLLDFVVKPEALAEVGHSGADFPSSELGLLPGAGDEYILTNGPFKGMRGFFTRDESNEISGLELAGRPYSHVRSV